DNNSGYQNSVENNNTYFGGSNFDYQNNIANQNSEIINNVLVNQNNAISPNGIINYNNDYIIDRAPIAKS
ncbi:10299_t:CDS:2, partial [Entrophospora sp. SA101]